MKSKATGKTLSQIVGEAERGQGLYAEEVQLILREADSTTWNSLFDLAKTLTGNHFRKRVHFFAPLYFSSSCVNDCTYCGFRRSNRFLKRRALTPKEFVEEARFLWFEGHRTILLIAGEHPFYSGVEQIARYLFALKKAELPFSAMVEIGPLDTSEYRFLHDLGVKHCLLFQETYNRRVYDGVHTGLKKNFDWRFQAMERMLKGGIERVGLGILIGIHDWKEDLVKLIHHAWHLKENFGVFPATLSFPRLRPAQGVSPLSPEMSEVYDEDFEKIIALARVALPSVGIVLTTREGPIFRRRLLELGIGVTHMSAGSSTLPGGYALEKKKKEGQFDLLDHRSLKEVSEQAKAFGYEPVFSDPFYSLHSPGKAHR